MPADTTAGLCAASPWTCSSPKGGASSTRGRTCSDMEGALSELAGGARSILGLSELPKSVGPEPGCSSAARPAVPWKPGVGPTTCSLGTTTSTVIGIGRLLPGPDDPEVSGRPKERCRVRSTAAMPSTRWRPANVTALGQWIALEPASDNTERRRDKISRRALLVDAYTGNAGVAAVPLRDRSPAVAIKRFQLLVCRLAIDDFAGLARWVSRARGRRRGARCGELQDLLGRGGLVSRRCWHGTSDRPPLQHVIRPANCCPSQVSGPRPGTRPRRCRALVAMSSDARALVAVRVRRRRITVYRRGVGYRVAMDRDLLARLTDQQRSAVSQFLAGDVTAGQLSERLPRGTERNYSSRSR
jgi:hypothetical protein